jgi:transposase-like protein
MQEKIGGNGSMVEIDESKFGKRKYYRGYRVEGVWVLGLIEKIVLKRLRLLTLKDRSKITLTDLIKNSRKDTIIYTDCCKGYYGLDKYSLPIIL